MELTFNKTANGYIADYTATTHFNLHIEGGGRVLLYKRTSGEKGDLLANIPSHGVVDIDIAVNFEATYTIVLEKRADVVVTTKDGEVINGVMPEEDTPSDAPSGYETFECADGAFEASDGAFYVKL